MQCLLGIVRKKVIVINQHYNIRELEKIRLPFLIMQNLALGHAFNSADLFQNFPLSKLKMTCEQCTKTYSDHNKRDLAASIFKRSLELVVDDIIENNIQFKFPPVGTSQAYLQMKRTQGEEFKRAFKAGKWRAIDFIKSNFCGYQLILRMISKKRPEREKPIYLGKTQANALIEYTNQGKQY